MRLFVAVNPSIEVLERIEQAMEEIRPLSPKSKWVRGENCHLTLAFLGQVDDAKVPAVSEAVVEAAARHAPLTLHFGGGGGFGKPRRPRVLWVSVTGETAALAGLAQDIAGALEPLGFPREDRPFMAHLTLARARDQGGDAGLCACAEALHARDFGDSRIDEVILYRSDLSPAGPRYTPVVRATLI
ncbi:MAG: RNA 2',3'-cyclic phosphodiesterase [Polyangiaceae bacterium]|nr:RNA 2',3'-cyclic phosphodiesterase [Polyangiaceae bacterium]